MSALSLMTTSLPAHVACPTFARSLRTALSRNILWLLSTFPDFSPFNNELLYVNADFLRY